MPLHTGLPLLIGPIHVVSFSVVLKFCGELYFFYISSLNPLSSLAVLFLAVVYTACLPTVHPSYVIFGVSVTSPSLLVLFLVVISDVVPLIVHLVVIVDNVLLHHRIDVNYINYDLVSC